MTVRYFTFCALFLLTTCFAGITGAKAQVSGNFTINSTLATGGNNFKTFGEAVASLAGGVNGAVVFEVAAGTGPYNEQVTLPAISGTSASNTVTFNGNGATVGFEFGAADGHAVIQLDGADFIRLNNLVIKPAGTGDGDFGYGVHLTNSADDNIISNCTIDITTAASPYDYIGILICDGQDIYAPGVNSQDRNELKNNTINGGYYGIAANSDFGSPAAANIIKGNKISDFYNYGIFSGVTNGIKIDSNYISRPTRSDVSDFYGIYITSDQLGIVTISRNRIFNPFGGDNTNSASVFGISLDGAAFRNIDNRIVNNLIYNLTGNGNVYGLYDAGTGNFLFSHNTISIDGASNGSGLVSNGIYLDGNLPNLFAVNNIVSISRSGNSKMFGIYQSNTSSTLLTDYNDYYIAKSAGGANMGFYAGATKATLADWRTTNVNNDINSLSADPVFTDPLADNFIPNSPVIDNKGFFFKETIDINGALRNTTNPDMGAYEFIIVYCSGTPVGGDAVVYGAPACAGSFLGLTVLNASKGASQTYQWQYSTSATGPFTNIGASLSNTPDFSTVATTALYYRVAITCSGNTAYSTPVFANVSPALPADVYFIDKNAAPGTPKTFLSFNDAKSALACGITGPVVFNVQPNSGPYLEQLVLNVIPGTSIVNTVTFNGNGNTIRFSSGNTDDRAVIKLAGADHIIFDSLTIDAEGSGTYGYGVQLLGGADSNVIRKSTIISTTSRIVIGRGGSNANNFVGIVLSNRANGLAGAGSGAFADGNLFDRNTIIGGAYGVAILGGGDFGNKNTVSNSNIQDFYYSGINLESTRGTVISGNIITRPTSSVIDEFNGVNSTDHDNLTITGNIIKDPFAAFPDNYTPATGINLTASADNTSGLPSLVTNNIIYLTGGLGDFNGIFTNSSNNTYYYHNTISIENNEADASGTVTGMYFQDNSDASAFVNNIVSVVSNTPNPKTAISWGGGNVNINNNDYFVNAGGTGYIGSFQGNTAVTLANWRTLTGKDAASVNFNPNFTDPAAGDFTPKKGQVDNIGTPVGVVTDITGVTRSTTKPDAGAIEFAVAPCTGTPVAGTAVATPGGPICLGVSFDLSLTGHGTGGFYLYQWQNAPTATGPWTNVSELLSEPSFTYESNLNTWYRAKVVCGDTSYTAAVQLALNALMPKGTYTINPALPSTYPQAGAGANFQTISEAAAAMNCGIAGSITFDIAKATYTEQVLISKIPGASDTSRVTFRGTAGTPSDVLMQFTATSSDNYVLKLDNASYLTFKDMSFSALSATQGRVVVLAGKSGADSIVGNVITMKSTTSTAMDLVGVYAEGIAGRNNVIKNNVITGGTYGVHLTGPDFYIPAGDQTIDGNKISGFYTAGINTATTAHLLVNNNKIQLKGALASTAYGIFSQYVDSSSQTVGNTITIEGTTTLVRGIGFQFCQVETQKKQLVANNTITTIGTNARVAGIHLYFSYSFRLVNNVVNISATGNQSYGVYLQFGGDFDMFNNTVQVSSTTATNNYVLLASSSGTEGYLRNNIFVHSGGGVVMRLAGAGSFNTDYNTYYTTGTSLFSLGTVLYPTLKSWQDLTTWDYNSIVYKPAFISSTDLHPKIDAPEVWAIHGRGVQVEGNNADINGSPRPDTLTEGVPDMGAYEFIPSSVPVALTATPAAPVANSTQVFMLGTDTVSKVTWGATVPAAITARRYSGIVAPGLPADAKYMYFYTDIDAGTGSTPYSIKQYYVDSWLGFIPKEKYARLAKTDAANAWSISGKGSVDIDSNILNDKDFTSLYKFTGLLDTSVLRQDPPSVVVPADSTNGGTKFWTSYAMNSFVLDLQNMQLYLGGLKTDAKVTVRVHGTTWKREYNVPAGTIVTTDLIPKSGYADARLQLAGISDRAISVESDQPITVNTYTFNSGSGSLLIPVGAYGHDYTAIVTKQSGQAPSFVNVIANYDNTLVEIVPSTSCIDHEANVPFTVVLNEGQVFQLLGSSTFGNDVSGTTVRSLKNSDGKCFPMAVFSGSGSTSVSCKDEAGQDPSFLYQQNLPSTSWGKEYMTMPTSRYDAASEIIKNVYRIAIRNVATVVKVNGNTLPSSSLVNNSYYEIESTTADYIQADEPVMVAQYMPSAGNCNTTLGDDLDNDMVYLSAADQGLKSVTFFRSGLGSIEANYLSLVVPNEGLPSLRIDGRASSTFDLIYAHTRPGYSVVIKRWESQTIQGTVTCDFPFTGINYGVGPNESYSYNLGIGKLNQLFTGTTITNTLGAADNTGNVTCVKTPFRMIVSTSVKPTAILWQFSKVPALVPNADSLQANPVVLDTRTVNGKVMYRYAVNVDAKFSVAGKYYVPVSLTGTDISSCDHTLETLVEVNVLGQQKATDFTVPAKACAKDIVTFTSSAVTNGDAGGNQNVVKWNWTISNGTTATTQNVTTAPLNVPGTYTVNLKMVTALGCLADTTKDIVVNALPVVALADTSVTICPEVKTIQFAIKDPVAGTIYNWYSTENGTTPVQTGTTITVNNVAGSFNYYVEGAANGCATKPRLKAEALIAVTPGNPVVKLDAADLTSLSFSWLPAANVIYYKVSVDNGTTWIDPSSGPVGLTHKITGLNAGRTINFLVRAYNDAGCVYGQGSKEGMTNSGKLFIPNSFTPNGDGKNDVFTIYGAEAAKEFRLMIFNQWGEKVYESTDRFTGWDGKQNGKYQPTGVYMYVCTFVLPETGEKVQMKGSVNLLR